MCCGIRSRRLLVETGLAACRTLATWVGRRLGMPGLVGFLAISSPDVVSSCAQHQLPAKRVIVAEKR